MWDEPTSVIAKHIKKQATTKDAVTADASLLDRLCVNPRFCKLLDRFDTNIDWVFIFEHCPEGNLTEFMVKNYGKPEKDFLLSERQGCAMAAQLLDALLHLNAKHIVHLRIKPESVLLFQALDGWSIKLGSFDHVCSTDVPAEMLAKLINYANSAASESTRSCEEIEFASPFMLTVVRKVKENNADAKSLAVPSELAHADFWSVVLIIHLLLRGQSLFFNAYLLAHYVQSHSSLLTAISAYLTAAQKVQSIGSAVMQVVSEEDSTAIQDLHVMQSIYNSWHTMSTALSFEQMLVDSSPALNSAAKQLQASFYASPSVASLVLLGIEHPSSVSSSAVSQLASDEASHQSLVQAAQYEKQWISNHPQYAAALSNLASNVISELTKHSDLVTVLTSVSQLVSGSTNAASISIAKVRSLVPSISFVISSFESIGKMSPQILCAERQIASYDSSLPQTVEQIWQGLTDTAGITDISYFSRLTGRYPALMRAFDTILSADRKYSSLQTVQSELIEAQKTDSDLLQQWQTYRQALDSITAQVTEYSFS